MAGVKGKSGGPRKNAGGARPNSGGARPGAGRKPVEPAVTGQTDAKAFLESVIAGLVEASPAQIRAAQALLPFQHKKLGESGKKEDKQDAAERVSKRFNSSAPPKLVAAGGKKV